ASETGRRAIHGGASGDPSSPRSPTPEQSTDAALPGARGTVAPPRRRRTRAAASPPARQSNQGGFRADRRSLLAGSFRFANYFRSVGGLSHVSRWHLS